MSKELTGIESAFCKSWGAWDEHDVGILGFYEIELLPSVSARLSLHPIDSMVIDTQRNIVEFYSGEDYQSFKLNVALGDPIL